MSTGTQKPFRPVVDPLESREVPAIVSAQMAGGVITVTGDNTGSNFTIDQAASFITIREVVSNDTRVFLREGVNRIEVLGGDGDDSFTTTGDVGIQVLMYGRKGNDRFFGGPGQDAMFGGPGRDVMYGGGGQDYIHGGRGADFIHGGDGRDILYGARGKDVVNGGQGTDAINGGPGDDVLIAIDNGTTDTLDSGEGGVDVLWYDVNGASQDSVTGITGEDFLRAVSAFANGADKTLDGDRIADPALPLPPAGGTPYQYETFDERPLFAVGGPGVDDVTQAFTGTGATFTPVLDDGWLLSAFSSMVDAYPNLIKTNMVDFGDSTYGVRLNGTYVRIDNDLPVTQFGNVVPAFAGVGPDESLWVPLLEKAFATISSAANPSYALLDRTLTPALNPSVAFGTFGAGTTFRAPGTFISAAQLGNFVATALNNNIAIALTVIGTPPATTPLLDGQSYSVLSYGLDVFGNVASVTVRNPFGIDGGGSTDLDPDDGYITVSIADLYATPGRLDFGDFSTV